MSDKIKLSLRVRPNCEAAPWVIAEIKLLEAIEVAAKYALRTYGLPSQIIAMDELSEALDSKEQT